jgi:hypothetical protein
MLEPLCTAEDGACYDSAVTVIGMYLQSVTALLAAQSESNSAKAASVIAAGAWCSIAMAIPSRAP